MKMPFFYPYVVLLLALSAAGELSVYYSKVAVPDMGLYIRLRNVTDTFASSTKCGFYCNIQPGCILYCVQGTECIIYGASTNPDIELPKMENFSSLTCFSKTLSSAQAPHQNGLPMNASDSEPVTEIPNNITTAPHNTTTIPSEFSEANTGGSETSIALGSTAAEARTEITTAVSSNVQPITALHSGASTASVNCTESNSNDSGEGGESSESCE